MTNDVTFNIGKMKTSTFEDENFVKSIYNSSNSPSSKKSHNRPTTRLVNKDGSYSVEHMDYPDSFKKHFRNAIHFTLEMQWRWVWLTVAILFPLSWTFFALLFYAVSYVHGDFNTQFQEKWNGSFVPCVQNVKSFVSLFLFSLESQETIGYGYRYDTEECPVLLFLLSVQVVLGAVLQACLCAVIWARMLRPKRRGQEVIFSKNACVSLNEQGELCLMFRMTDINGTFLVQSAVRMYLAVKKRMADTPNILSFKLYHMHMGEENGRDKLLFLWPIIACHVIDHRSPLYAYSKEDLDKSQLEFIAVAEGIVESTGLTVQTRTSYIPNEILWGYKFLPMNFVEKGKSCKVTVKYRDFDSVFPIETPACSAKEMDQIRVINHSRLKKFASVENFPNFYKKSTGYDIH